MARIRSNVEFWIGQIPKWQFQWRYKKQKVRVQICIETGVTCEINLWMNLEKNYANGL